MIYELDIKKEFIVSSLISFLRTFIEEKYLTEKEVLEHYKVESIQDVLESSEFTCDSEEIEFWLNQIKDKSFTIDFVDVRCEEFWVIREIKQKEEDKLFHITSLSKEDIIQVYEDSQFGDDELFMKRVKLFTDNLTDIEMEYVAGRMSDGFCNCCYWVLLRDILESKFTQFQSLNEFGKED